jgi:hypothetical protein
MAHNISQHSYMSMSPNILQHSGTQQNSGLNLNLNQKSLCGGVLLGSIIIFLVGIVYCSGHRMDGCMEYNCVYTDIIDPNRRGCIIDVVIDTILYSCESLFLPCPLDRSTPCFVYDNNISSCPMVGSCSNQGYNMCTAISTIAFAITVLIAFIIIVCVTGR